MLALDQVFISRDRNVPACRMEPDAKTSPELNSQRNHTNNLYNDNDDANFADNSWQNHNQVAVLPSWFVLQLTATASLGGCLFGYDMGAISGTLPQLANTFDLDDRQKELCE